MPQKGKQELAFNTDADIIIYGGSAGCVPATTEFLTDSGWKRFDNYKKGDCVATYSPDSDELVFTKEVSYIKLPCNDMESLVNRNFQMTLSHEHDVLCWEDGKDKHSVLSWYEVLKRKEMNMPVGRIKTTFGKVINNSDNHQLDQLIATLEIKTSCVDKIFSSVYYKSTNKQLKKIFEKLSFIKKSSFSSKHKSDCDFIQYVFCSQGLKTAIEKDKSRKLWTIKSEVDSYVSLNNKFKQKTIKTLDGFKYCFQTKTGFFIARENGEIFLTGNSGKSRLILLRAGYHAHKDPNFEAVLFRRTSPPLKAAGGLFTEAKKLYSAMTPKVREKDMEIIFNTTGGGNLKFTHLEHESDAEKNHQGLQYSAVFFDELTHFEQSQFIYLIGRLRSNTKGSSYMMATTNPDMDSWVMNWVRWYLDEDGYFDESKLGIKRYFLTIENQPVFGDTEEELAAEYPELCWQQNDKGENVYVPPMSFIFIGGTIFDNPALIRSNPKYLSALKAQTTVNRKRLLDGCWYAREEGCNYFQREWLGKLDKIPLNEVMSVRAWDLGSSEPSEKNMKPDWTASVKMLKLKNNDVVIVGDYDKSSLDTKTNISGRFRKRTGERDMLILKQAEYDGEDTYIVIPKDPAAAGALAFSEMSKFFTKHGFIVKQDPAPSNKSKLKKFEPFSTAAQNGLVYIVESSFTPETLNAFYYDLEAFNGERSTSDRKDDWPDSVASGYNALTKTKVFSNYGMPEVNSRTRYSLAIK